MKRLTDKQKATNAIKWIDNLPNYKQAQRGERGILGNEELGYCCLGAGCHILNIKHYYRNRISLEFTNEVGLKNSIGYFDTTDDSQRYYEKDALTKINDHTDAGFDGIATLLKRHPDWVFEKEVADLIKKHYEIY